MRKITDLSLSFYFEIYSEMFWGSRRQGRWCHTWLPQLSDHFLTCVKEKFRVLFLITPKHAFNCQVICASDSVVKNILYSPSIRLFSPFLSVLTFPPIFFFSSLFQPLLPFFILPPLLALPPFSLCWSAARCQLCPGVLAQSQCVCVGGEVSGRETRGQSRGEVSEWVERRIWCQLAADQRTNTHKPVGMLLWLSPVLLAAEAILMYFLYIVNNRSKLVYFWTFTLHFNCQNILFQHGTRLTDEVPHNQDFIVVTGAH